MAEMKRMVPLDVEVNAPGFASPPPSRGINTVTCMFIFSLSVAVVALVLGGVAVARTNMPAPIVPTINNNLSPPTVAPTPAPAPPSPFPPSPPPSNFTPGPAPPPFPQPVPNLSLQRSLLVRNSTTGNQAALYFVTVYSQDPTCSIVSQLYDPVRDFNNIGLRSNPVVMDRLQSDCFPVAHGVSWGNIAASSRHLSFRQFFSNDCSGIFQDFVRLIATDCIQISSGLQIYYKVSMVDSRVNALQYPLPAFGYESFDYHPAYGQFIVGSVYAPELTIIDSAASALRARPFAQGGNGYAAYSQIRRLTSTGFNFTNQAPGGRPGFLEAIGVNVVGVKVDYAILTDMNGQPVVRNRVWACRAQFFGDQSTSPFGGASVVDFGSTNAPQIDFDMGQTKENLRTGANQEIITTSQAQTLTGVGATFAGILINDVAIDPTTGDAYFTDSFNCRILKVTMPPQGGIVGATTSVWYSTVPGGAMCPNGYGQVGSTNTVNNNRGQAIITGNGISIYHNSRTGARTLVVVFSFQNGRFGPPSHNAVKIGINTDGSFNFNDPNSKMTLNRIGMDGARFLNPFRPRDLYITNFQFNAFFINFATDVDPRIGVQIIRFSEDDLNVSRPVAAPAALKYCSPSAGRDNLDAVRANSANPQRPLSIKLFNSADCNPLTTYPSTTDPAALNLSPNVIGNDGVINIPYTSSACNSYTPNATGPRFFQIRCMNIEQSNGIFTNSKYQFQDFATAASCSNSRSPTSALLPSGRCEPLRDTNPLRYYIATCSSSNINPHSVTFYTDSTCTMVHQDATTAAPGAPAGTMAALEYPCVAISGTSSISAGGHNEALHGVGSVLLWSRSNSCSGLNDVGTSRVTNFHPNDGECVSPNTFPPNEFSVAALSGRPVSYRFFLNGNSQACKGGVTTAAFIPNQNAQEGELYGLCANGFQFWGLSLFRFGDENRCDAA